MKKIILLLILIPSISFGGSMNMIGEKGDPAEVSKAIIVKMYDNYYEPNKFEIKWSWVKAHSTDKLNNEVDLIAREAAKI